MEPSGCPVCGSTVTQPRQGRPRIFCSDECRRTADNARQMARRVQRRRVARICPTCGETFASAKDIRQRFCSAQCRELSYRKYRPGDTVPCMDCGQPIVLESTIGGWRFGRRCPDCRRVHNTDKCRTRGARRREPDAEDVTLAYLYERDRGRCGLCGGKVSLARRHPDPLSASADHVVPVSLGGSHTRANLQLAHLACNVRKNARAVGEQLRLVG